MNTMLPASEAMYFHREPVAHIVAFQERERLGRIQRNARDAVRRAPARFDWAASNARLEQSAANTTALIEQMRADHAADAEFHDRWNAMSYREAVEFHRARTQEPTPC